MLRRFNISRRFVGVTCINNTSRISTSTNSIINSSSSSTPITTTRQQQRDYASRHTGEKNKEKGDNIGDEGDKKTTDYLEKMMDEEQKSQESSERVDPDYWRDPGSHNDEPESSGVDLKNPQANKRSQPTKGEKKSADKK